MNQNKWFKHWNHSHLGQTISQLWGEREGPELIAFYWTVLEMVSLYEDLENRGYWNGNLSIFKSKLGMNRNRSYKLLCKICVTFNIKVTWISQESFQLFVTNWLEFQENRGGKRSPKQKQNTDRSKKKEVRSKKKEINTTEAELYPDEFKPLASELVSREVPARLVLKWKELYGATWVIDEINKALSWELANPNRKAKEFPRFMAGWLSRGWDNKKQKEAQQTHQPQIVGTRLVDLS